MAGLEIESLGTGYGIVGRKEVLVQTAEKLNMTIPRGE